MAMFMRILLIAGLLVVGSDAGFQRASTQANQSFAGYMKAFGKNYVKGSSEHGMRELVFNQRLAEILDHNAAGKSWEMGLNQFTDWTEAELLSLRGFRRAHKADAASGAQGVLLEMAAEGGSMMEVGIDDTSCGAKDASCSNAQSCCGGLICGANTVCEKPAGATEALDYSHLATSMEVMNQGACGSCWAVAAAAAIQLQAAKKEPLFNKVLSPENINKCAPNPLSCGGEGGCQGSTPGLAFTYLKTLAASKGGLTSMDNLPYTASTGAVIPEASCSAGGALSFLQMGNLRSRAQQKPAVSIADWIKVKDNHAEQVMNSLTSVGPLAVAVVGAGIQGYARGVMSGCQNMVVDHAVVMMGYGKDKDHGLYWNIRNSWGKAWGENGFFRLRRHYAAGTQTTGDPNTDDTFQGEPCAWDNEPAKGVACKDPATGKYPARTRVCGECGIVSDVAYPTGITVDPKLLSAASPDLVERNSGLVLG